MYFSKIAAEAAYMMNIMKERVTWKNQLAKYMIVKSHSSLIRGQIIGYHQSERKHQKKKKHQKKINQSKSVIHF